MAGKTKNVLLRLLGSRKLVVTLIADLHLAAVGFGAVALGAPWWFHAVVLCAVTVVNTSAVWGWTLEDYAAKRDQPAVGVPE